MYVYIYIKQYMSSHHPTFGCSPKSIFTPLSESLAPKWSDAAVVSTLVDTPLGAKRFSSGDVLGLICCGLAYVLPEIIHDSLYVRISMALKTLWIVQTGDPQVWNEGLMQRGMIP